MGRYKKHAGSVRAVEVGGNEHILHICTTMIEVPTRGDLNAEIEGMKELRTDEGLAVNRLGKGEYEIVQTGEILRSQAPDAP